MIDKATSDVKKSAAQCAAGGGVLRESARRLPLAVGVLLLASGPLLGCSGAADDGGASGNLAASTPPIHVTQSSVLLKDGAPAVEKSYREALAHCSGSPLPVKPLPADVVGKLGHTYLEVWYEGRRMAVKADRWDFKGGDAGPGCTFEPVHQSQLTIIEPGSSTVVDLVNGSATREDSQGVVRESVAAGDAPTGAAQDDEARLRAAVAGELQRNGQGDLMPEAGGTAQAAGQPCVQTRDGQGESCVWSGGGKWGFVTDDAVTADRMDAPVDSIPLWSKPADGNGYELTTQSMTVGVPIDDKVFAAPKGITVKGQG